MNDKMIRCPKCSNEQRSRVECEVCGVIFAKYLRYQERRQEERAAHESGKDKSSKKIRMLLMSLALVALSAGGTYYFMAPAGLPVSSPVEQAATQAVEEKVIALKPAAAPVVQVLPQRNKSTHAGTGSIEAARRATVSVETPWGSGSGFFLNDNYIVTNRHVVEIDQDQLAEFRRKVEASRELIELEKKKLQDYRARMRQMPNNPSRNQLKIIVEEGERELNKVMPQYQEAEQRLARMEEKLQPSDIKIILADGSSHNANYLLLSDKHDLALMSLYVNGVPHLQRHPEERRMQQGEKVFTIGSPVGLRNTVTSGVFSGFRVDQTDGKLFLQTDAPINPGNSGGPLIDEQGYVYGVNTMIIQGTEGIGFAIPIETVFEEFGSSLF